MKCREQFRSCIIWNLIVSVFTFVALSSFPASFGQDNPDNFSSGSMGQTPADVTACLGSAACQIVDRAIYQRKFIPILQESHSIRMASALRRKELSVESKTYGERQNIKSETIPLSRHCRNRGRVGSCCLGRNAYYPGSVCLSDYAIHQHGRWISTRRRQWSTQPLGRATGLSRARVRA